MSDPMPGKPHDFVVRLEGLPLDKAAQERIAAAIRGAVVAELGRLDFASIQPRPSLSYIPIHWMGIWLRDASNLPGLGEFKKNLGVTEQ
jgi:hypothetical protein